MKKILHDATGAKKKAPKKKTTTESTKRFPLVHVLWLDAAHSGADGWTDKDGVKIPMLAAEACGFLVHDGPNDYGEECIALAAAIVHNVDDWPDYCLSFTIPKGMIVSIKEIKV